LDIGLEKNPVKIIDILKTTGFVKNRYFLLPAMALK